MFVFFNCYIAVGTNILIYVRTYVCFKIKRKEVVFFLNLQIRTKIKNELSLDLG